MWIISHETGETKQLTEGGFVSMITDWSPDGTKIVYYCVLDDLEKRNNVPNGGTSDTAKFTAQDQVGFYQIDINTGQKTPLAAVDYIEGFINNTQLLTKKDSESKTLVTFDTKTLVANQAKIKQTAGFGVGQFDFSNDGTKWVYLYSVDEANPTAGETQIVMGDFPNKATEVVDSGPWAFVQSPLFSPDSKNVAYQKSTGLVNGYPQDHVWVYDTTTKNKVDYGLGRPLLWTDTSTLLVQKKSSDGGQFGDLVLLDIETKKETKVYSYK